MFTIGGMEMVVIGVVALIVLGPDKLPAALRQVGSAAGQLRRMSQDLQVDLRQAPLDREFPEAAEELDRPSVPR